MGEPFGTHGFFCLFIIEAVGVGSQGLYYFLRGGERKM
jgi:hypothetical protein